MNRYHFAFALLLALLQSACATSPRPDDYADRISTTWLATDRFVVSYSGLRSSTDAEIVDLALLRSAEIALQNGFNYFIVVDGSEPAAAADGSLQTAGAEFTVSKGQRYRHGSPGRSNTIVGFERKPPGFAYVALFVKASLRAKYGLDQVDGAI